MRFNDKELSEVAKGECAIEGVLHHMKPQEKDWSDWYQQPSFKERIFKLISNLMFYYKVNETEPLGVIVLENVQVSYERPHKGIPFAFSLSFKTTDKSWDAERKHIFSCRCEQDVNRWVSALKEASYEYWRTQYMILKTKLCMKTGQDPVLNYMREQRCTSPAGGEKVKKKKSTFRSHIQVDIVAQDTSLVPGISNGTMQCIKESDNNDFNTTVKLGKLIDI